MPAQFVTATDNLNFAIGVTSLALPALSITLGNLIVAFSRSAVGQTTTSVTDTIGNVYVKQLELNSINSVGALFTTISTGTNAANVITLNFSAATTCTGAAAQYNNVFTATPEQTASAEDNPVDSVKASISVRRSSLLVGGAFSASSPGPWTPLNGVNLRGPDVGNAATALMLDQLDCVSGNKNPGYLLTGSPTTRTVLVLEFPFNL